MKVRKFSLSDSDRVIALWHDCFPGGGSPWNDPEDIIRRKQDVQPELFLVGEVEDKIVATALGGYDGFRGWIYHVAADPTRRREGIGRQIVTELETRLLMQGAPKINLQIHAPNPEVVAFYQSLGYRIEDRVSMTKAAVSRSED